jgi:hypothetical protein
MASITTLRYEGSIAELRGCSVLRMVECGCSKCLVSLDDRHVTVTVDNFGPVRMTHARRSSFVECIPAKGSNEERAGRLLAALRAA